MNEQTAPMNAPRWFERPVSRDPDDDKLGGVVAGLCRTYGFDVRTTRIAVAVATIVLPVLALVYVAAWTLLPDRPERAVSLEAIVRDRRRMPLYIAVGIVLVAGGIGSLGSWFLFGGVPWGLGLIAVGVLLWVTPTLGSKQGPPGAPNWEPPSAQAATATGPTAATATAAKATAAKATAAKPETGTTDAVTVTRSAEPAFAAATVPRRQRVPVGAVAVVAAFGFAALAASGDAIDWWDMSMLTGLLTVLAILVAGAAVSALVNRSWLPLPAVLTIGALLALLAVVQPDLDGGTGGRRLQPTTLSQLDRRTELGIGELVVDLTELDVSAGRVQLEIEVGIGRLHLVVPADATIELTSEVGAGELRIDGVAVLEGIRHDDARTLAPPAAGAEVGGPTYAIDVRVGLGQIDVERGGS